MSDSSCNELNIIESESCGVSEETDATGPLRLEEPLDSSIPGNGTKLRGDRQEEWDAGLFGVMIGGENK